jgi:hypothetical protein
MYTDWVFAILGHIVILKRSWVLPYFWSWIRIPSCACCSSPAVCPYFPSLELSMSDRVRFDNHPMRQKVEIARQTYPEAKFVCCFSFSFHVRFYFRVLANHLKYRRVLYTNVKLNIRVETKKNNENDWFLLPIKIAKINFFWSPKTFFFILSVL